MLQKVVVALSALSWLPRDQARELQDEETMYGDINGYSSRGGKGGGGGRRAVGTADFYRRVPKEMTEVCHSVMHRIYKMHVMCISL